MIKKVKILSNLSYQEFPISADMVEIDEEDLKQIGITKQFDNNGSVIEYSDKSKRIAELKQLLDSTDYQALKWAEKELTDYEYEPMRLQRKAWREEIRELEKLI